MDIIYIIAGLVLLFLGGEALVRGSVTLARRMGISTLLVSLIVVGFGTSAPELLVCIDAALRGVPDMALGNAVGSNIANVFLILGVAALIAPLSCTGKAISRDAIAVIVVSVLLGVMSFLDAIDWRAGIFMLAALVTYLYMAYRSERKSTVALQAAGQETNVEDVDEHDDKTVVSLVFLLGGLLALVAGAHMLVEGATSVARSFGISEAVIGLSLIALGTSLPELATAIVAAMKGRSDIIIGNVLGSNLFNILSILGITALITPLPMQGRIADLDVWIMLGSAIVLYPAIMSGRVISRLEGGIFLALYCGYIAFMFVS
ncbi:MAG: calcium/sodium antiporter [Pseudomonadota bacterium]